jgi:shikimate 5-dehydrogenase
MCRSTRRSSKAARRIGCATIDGGHMNVGQAIGAFRLFTGLDADAARMERPFPEPCFIGNRGLTQ